jgi:hypothetical protein
VFPDPIEHVLRLLGFVPLYFLQAVNRKAQLGEGRGIGLSLAE